jgi:hypothetical protein
MAEKTNNKPDENKGIRWLINSGAEIAGSAVGGALGFLAAGPAGAAILGAGGATVAIALKHIGQETSERFLGPREAVRIGGVLALATEEIRQRIEAGENIRSDDFFEQKQSGRSDAEEVVESILLKSQKEPEEKKLLYMAHLLSSIAFNTEISAYMAHQITKIAEQLTYRQLCILKLAFTKEEFVLRQENYRSHTNFTKNLYQVLYEIHDLERRGLVVFGVEVIFGLTDISPNKIKVEGLGKDIVHLMKLNLIPKEDILPVVTQLK